MRRKILTGFTALVLAGSGLVLGQDFRDLHREGFDQGYRCVVSGRDCDTDRRTRDMNRDQRRAFDRAFREGAQKARADHGWGPPR